ncbi:hypothetical protein IEQ34_020145 [Dendrobium chrysotoxum]|uniref:Uncharacterized protein n=1 Tax=Dendrobium chrysotoxum TaxID=161865 RepID=A0AAV7G1A8_DENCH|nr:hypothetical protein IEQ34_020145 [Dendrobium chrysotoxum]
MKKLSNTFRNGSRILKVTSENSDFALASTHNRLLHYLSTSTTPLHAIKGSATAQIPQMYPSAVILDISSAGGRVATELSGAFCFSYISYLLEIKPAHHSPQYSAFFRRRYFSMAPLATPYLSAAILDILSARGRVATGIQVLRFWIFHQLEEELLQLCNIQCASQSYVVNIHERWMIRNLVAFFHFISEIQLYVNG